MTAKIKEEDYLFASACIKSMERNLLSKDKVQKMIDSKTPSDALRVLLELNYGDGEEITDANDFEKLLVAEQRKVYETISSIAPNKEYFNMFRYPYDYHNIKVFLKSEFLSSESEELTQDGGTIAVEQLQIFIRDRNFIQLTINMKDGVNQVIDTFSRTSDPQVIDLILDTYCYSDMAESAFATENDFLMGYIKLLIDIVNLKTFVRLKKMGKGWDFFSKVFLQNGNIPEKLFISSYEEAFEQFAEKLLPYGLQESFYEGNLALKDAGMFTVLEKLFDNVLMDYVRDAKYKPFGIEPVMGFVIAKENELKIARIIMAGKLADLSPEVISERLRETYV